MFRFRLEMLRQTMMRAHPLCRLGVASAVVLVAMTLGALSTATRMPYHNQNTVTWHVSKASRMSQSASQASTRVPKAETRRLEAVEPEAAAPWPRQILRRTFPPAIRAHHFRSPPVLS